MEIDLTPKTIQNLFYQQIQEITLRKTLHKKHLPASRARFVGW